MIRPFLSPLFAGLLMAVASLVLAGCSSADTRRIATDAVGSSIRSACTSARNCTIDCAEGAKCTQTP